MDVITKLAKKRDIYKESYHIIKACGCDIDKKCCICFIVGRKTNEYKEIYIGISFNFTKTVSYFDNEVDYDFIDIDTPELLEDNNIYSIPYNQWVFISEEAYNLLKNGEGQLWNKIDKIYYNSEGDYYDAR